MKAPSFLTQRLATLKPQADITESVPVSFPQGSALARALAAAKAMRESAVEAALHSAPDSAVVPDDAVAQAEGAGESVDAPAPQIEEQPEAIEPESEPEVLHGEIIPPSTEIANVGFDAEPESLSYEVDADHLRRAAAKAATIFNIMEGVNITPDPSQVHAVHTLVREQYGCLIGAAGTGKTTTTRMLLHTLMNGDAAAGIEPMRIDMVDMKGYRKNSDSTAEEDSEAEMERALNSRIPSIALCAFTGQATQVLRKNLPPAWKGNAMTIHSLLAFAPEEYFKADGTKSMRFAPTYTKNLRMPWDVIVVDEASMVNLELWHMLLDAAKPGCRFYFIGDLNQLPPPVGQGILGFALAKWKVCELTVVHRQTEEAANRILDTAWAVLKGQVDGITFDDPKTNPNWRVIGFELDNQVDKAHVQVVNLALGLSKKKVDASVDPEQPLIYDPWRDRIMTPGNGFNAESVDHLMGQHPINEALSRLLIDAEIPRIIIDAQRAVKKFAVGYRVMATKNESPEEVNRVTNGLTGKITGIYPNPKWYGDTRLVGEEAVVAENRKNMVLDALDANRRSEALADINTDDVDAFEMTIQHDAKEDKISGPASHIVHVTFDNGAKREYSLNSEVEQLQIAYASTTHKAQGAEMPTAVIVVHHASKFGLSRENLYTAITRAKSRVILLYTKFGLRIAISKQKVSGRNLQEKIANYLRLMGGENGEGFKTVKVRLGEEE